MLQKFMNKPCTLAGINGAEVKLSEGVGQLCSFSDTQSTSSNPDGKGHPTGSEGGRAGAAGGGCSPLPALPQLIYSGTDCSFVKHHQGSDPWVLPFQHSNWVPKGAIPWVIYTGCSCQSQGMQGSHPQTGTSPSGTPALGTKPHPSQIASPAAHLWEWWQHGGDRGDPTALREPNIHWLPPTAHRTLLDSVMHLSIQLQGQQGLNGS